MIELIFIGNQYYLASGTRMSSLYHPTSEGFSRWDWGKVSVALENGQEVRIRPATEEEAEYFEIMFQRNYGREIMKRFLMEEYGKKMFLEENLGRILS